jgi:hypothetical protein
VLLCVAVWSVGCVLLCVAVWSVGCVLLCAVCSVEDQGSVRGNKASPVLSMQDRGVRNARVVGVAVLQCNVFCSCAVL